MKARIDLLIISNGGIYVDDNKQAYCPKDDVSIVSDLSRNGLSVVYCSTGYKKPSSAVNRQPLNFAYLSLRGFKYKTVFIGWVRLFIAILKSNYVYVYYPGGLSKQTAILCHLIRKEYGVYVRGYGLYSLHKKNSQETLSDMWILERARHIITVSPAIKAALIKTHDRVSVIKSTMDWDLSNVFLRNTIIKKELWNLLFVGSVIELKGVDDLSEVGNYLDKAGFNFKLQIIGDGHLLRTLKEKQIAGQITSRIEFKGAIHDRKTIESYFEKADAFVFPTRTEGFPRVLFEAMLKKLPIFTTMVGGIPGYMKDRYNCIEIPVNSPSQQAKIILNSVNDPNLLNGIVEHGLDTVKYVLTNNHTHVEALLKEYQE